MKRRKAVTGEKGISRKLPGAPQSEALLERSCQQVCRRRSQSRGDERDAQTCGPPLLSSGEQLELNACAHDESRAEDNQGDDRSGCKVSLALSIQESCFDPPYDLNCDPSPDCTWDKVNTN